MSIIPESRMSAIKQLPEPGSQLIGDVTVPVHERVLDRLADLLFNTDELLDMLNAEDANRLRWLEPHVTTVYRELNEAMKRLSD